MEIGITFWTKTARIDFRKSIKEYQDVEEYLKVATRTAKSILEFEQFSEGEAQSKLEMRKIYRGD